jgi:hypothetical protein
LDNAIVAMLRRDKLAAEEMFTPLGNRHVSEVLMGRARHTAADALERPTVTNFVAFADSMIELLRACLDESAGDELANDVHEDTQ